MKFINLIDFIQFFANEHCLPKNKVLILGLYDPDIKRLFEFIDAIPFFVKDTFEEGIDIIADYTDLPFEEHSFDIIINFTTHLNINVSGIILNIYLNGKCRSS